MGDMGEQRTAGRDMIHREYKDRLFRFIFGAEENREHILSLYNALRGTGYTDADKIVITTLDDVIYLGMKNDVSFMLASDMNLFEHQSTYNPNMPLRGFSYFARLYEKYISEHDLDLYGIKLVKIPAPRYIVFYNGEKPCGERTELKLSDSFIAQAEGYEWTAVMLNINRGYNRELMEKCAALKEYSDFIALARENHETGLPVEQAVDEAVRAAIGWKCLGQFMKKHRSEVKAMFLTEYNKERHERTCREEGWEEGLEKGLMEGWKKGRDEGLTEGITGTIRTLRKLGHSDDEIQMVLKDAYGLSDSEAGGYML